MKTKQFNKKLALNKRTVANLNIRSMQKLRGGADTDETCTVELTCYTCVTCKPLICDPSLVCTGSPCQHTEELCG